MVAGRRAEVAQPRLGRGSSVAPAPRRPAADRDSVPEPPPGDLRPFPTPGFRDRSASSMAFALLFAAVLSALVAVLVALLYGQGAVAWSIGLGYIAYDACLQLVLLVTAWGAVARNARANNTTRVYTCVYNADLCLCRAWPSNLQDQSSFLKHCRTVSLLPHVTLGIV